jgi:hypothetical protein
MRMSDPGIRANLNRADDDNNAWRQGAAFLEFPGWSHNMIMSAF